MGSGRLTDYSEKMLKKAQEYLDGGYETTANPLFPSVVGLAGYLGVARSTVNLWGTQAGKEPFSDILEQIQVLQHDKLLSKGLTGDYNASIAKLALGKHGYSDKQELTGKDGTPLAPPTLTIKFEDADPDL